MCEAPVPWRVRGRSPRVAWAPGVRVGVGVGAGAPASAAQPGWLWVGPPPVPPFSSEEQGGVAGTRGRHSFLWCPEGARSSRFSSRLTPGPCRATHLPGREEGRRFPPRRRPPAPTVCPGGAEPPTGPRPHLPFPGVPALGQGRASERDPGAVPARPLTSSVQRLMPVPRRRSRSRRRSRRDSPPVDGPSTSASVSGRKESAGESRRRGAGVRTGRAALPEALRTVGVRPLRPRTLRVGGRGSAGPQQVGAGVEGGPGGGRGHGRCGLLRLGRSPQVTMCRLERTHRVRGWRSCPTKACT